MILIKKLRYLPAMVLMVMAFTSCDDDFSTIGGELVGGQYDALPYYEAGVVAYNQKIQPVQTNNLPLHLLGVYNEPVYGEHIANVLTQLSLSSNNPRFGNEPRLDSVVLTIPYFSTQLEADEEGDRSYRLDSIYGNSPFNLSISRSNFFLNDFDPEANFENRQRYYSDMGPAIENSVAEPFFEIESFRPSPSEVSYREIAENGTMDTVSVSPRMRIHLPLEFFQENIIDREGSAELFNSNNFRNFLRGIYLKAEPVNGEGSMMLLNFADSDAGIVLYYTNTLEGEGDEDDTEEENSFKINFGPNIVNTYSQELPGPIQEEISSSNEATGEENLYLKGGEGSMAVIDLFEDEAELEDLRSRDWLLNEANLTFYVNQDLVEGGQAEPERIYLYDLESNELLYDYLADPTAEVENPRSAYQTHAPRLVRDEDGNGTYYRIRITEHLRRILSGDIDNRKLGLVVIQNIKTVNNAWTRSSSQDLVRRIPTGTVITPKGTVLHGNLSPDEDKRLKFNIYYTETSN